MAEGGGEAKAVGGTSTVFVSYASRDAGIANAIVEALETAGLKCWIAPRDVVPGEFYADAIVRAIDAAKVIVLTLSQNAAASPHVLREVERASSKRHPVVSFRIDLAPLPAGLEYFLNTSQWLDASATGADRALPRLVEAVQRAVAPAGSMDSDASGAAARPATPTGGPAVATATVTPRLSRAVVTLLAVTAVILAYFVVDKFWLSGRPKAGQTTAPLVTVSDAANPAATAISEKSVAVLPFTDMSEKKDQEYFSDGMAEEIIDLLVKIPELRVPARTSSFYFKGKSADIPTIAKHLMVAHVLEGSVRRSGKHLRVTAQLVRADNGYHLWSETYDREFDDVFKVQDEIAGAVVKALKVSLLSGAIPRVTPTSSTETYSAFLQARYLTDRDNPEDLDKAVALYERAIAADPNYAPAHAWLAWCYERRVANGIDTDGVGYAKARAAAERAIALDPTLPEGYLTLGTAHLQYEFDWAAAAEMTGKAQALDAKNSLMLQSAGHLALATRTPADAQSYYRRAVEQDPLNMVPRRYLGKALYYGGRLAEAETTLRRIIELNPQFPAAHYFLGVVLLARGDPQAALTAIEAEPEPTWKSFGLPLAYWALGRKVEAHTALADLVAHSAGAEFQVAEAYAYIGEPDQAFHWLDEARERHDPGLIHVRADPLLQSLFRDPRYAVLLHKMKLPA
jgi:TolB-like protein/Tfp pilus assembly protein PilF